ncbi:hypothetical protein ABZZ20_29035 [Streptomyces sp. NPDC006430]|uniref:hypothetical protein n=1 Tax=Streptomyces sp. NPDC006430 TaxID=3154299 RepID=UPI0033ABB134
MSTLPAARLGAGRAGRGDVGVRWLGRTFSLLGLAAAAVRTASLRSVALRGRAGADATARRGAGSARWSLSEASRTERAGRRLLPAAGSASGSLSVRGIKTGSSAPAGGVLMWAAYESVGDETPLILGTLMQQRVDGPDPYATQSLALALTNSRKITEAVRMALTEPSGGTRLTRLGGAGPRFGPWGRAGGAGSASEAPVYRRSLRNRHAPRGSQPALGP